MNRLSAIKIANSSLKKENKRLLDFTSLRDEEKKEMRKNEEAKRVPELVKAIAQSDEGLNAGTNVFEV